jgi:hypothetical protein
LLAHDSTFLSVMRSRQAPDHHALAAWLAARSSPASCVCTGSLSN